MIHTKPPQEEPRGQQDRLRPTDGNVRCRRSLADFERACLVTIDDESRKPLGDTGLIALLMDAIGVMREYIQLSAGPASPKTDQVRILVGARDGEVTFDAVHRLLDRATLAEDRLAIVEQQYAAAWKQLLELGIERNGQLAPPFPPPTGRPPMPENFLRALFLLAGIPIVRIHKLANAYWSADSETDPWWLVEVESASATLITIGWRKRVINIDWSSTLVRKVITKDETTKEETMVHAWGYAKAVEYLGEWHRKQERAEYVKANVVETIGEVVR